MLGAEAAIADLSDRAIKVAVIKKVDKIDVSDDRSDEFVAGAFEIAVARFDGADAALAAVRTVAVDAAPRADEIPDENAARLKMERDSANAWKSTTEVK